MKSAARALSDLDWNFDAVPDKELVACCYWEYARESAFICEVRQRCLDPKWREMTNTQFWEYCGHDIEKIQSIGYESEVFLPGFFCLPEEVLRHAPPPKSGEAHQVTGEFPKPWQGLTTADRCRRSKISSDVERIPLVPFKRGTSSDAQDILDLVKAQRAQADFERGKVRRKNPKLNEETLMRLRKLKFPEIKPAVYWDGGREVTIVAIQWNSFTNDEIVNYFRYWVRVNRPQLYSAPSGKGHKLKDWRANLTRLAVMRLLSRLTATEVINDRQNKFAVIWKTKQFAGHKWADTTKWYDARREAGKLFHKLFPFLPANEKPISWERQSPGK